ncbi:MAG TPA: FecR domain-containing protein [Gammaproteobacteria bacterium]
MHHDNPDASKGTTQNPGRDVLGELIHAAGRRPNPSSEHYRKTFAATHAVWQRKLRSARRRQRMFALAASIAIVAIGIGIVLRVIPTGPAPAIAIAAVVHGDVAAFSADDGEWRPVSSPGFELRAGDRLRTAGDGGTAFALGREVSVRLNTTSELVFVSDSTLELVAGTVYIDSGSGDSGDLEISTPHGRLRDIGTQFEAATLTEGLRVRIREGLVQLYRDGGDPAFEGGAGEEFRVDSRGTISQEAFSRHDPAWEWAEALAGPPDTDGMPVLEFLNWVSRETGREILFDGRDVQLAAGSAILHGSAQDLTPMDALDVMLATTNFEYSVRTDGVIVISRRDMR